MKDNIKSTEKFADMKNISTFAMLYNFKGGEVRKNLWAVFMSARKHIRFHTPVSSVNATRLPLRCIATGQCGTVLLFPHNDLINKLLN